MRGDKNIAKAIAEMRKNEALWNTKDLKFLPSVRQQAAKDAAKRLGITHKQCVDLVYYVKKRYLSEYQHRKDKEHEEGNDKEDLNWKWFDQCEFLEPLVHMEKKPPRSRSRSPNSPQKKDDDDVMILDPDTEFVCISDNESGNGKEDYDQNGLSMEEDPIDTQSFVPENHRIEEPMVTIPTKSEKDDKKFLIEAICSTMKFQLENSNCTNEKLVLFHSDIIKYMHMHFKKRRK